MDNPDFYEPDEEEEPEPEPEIEIEPEEEEEPTEEEKMEALRQECDDEAEDYELEEEKSHKQTKNYFIFEDLKGGMRFNIGSDTDNLKDLMEDILWFKLNWFHNPEFNKKEEKDDKANGYFG